MTIAFVTTTRADWGLLSPLARELRQRGHAVNIIAGNMHFLPECGYTCREIESDGFSLDCRIMPESTPALTAAAMLSGTAAALGSLAPQCVVLLGDRYEILAAAQAAVLSHIPLVHIAGGAVSEGAFDDSFRHAMTKLASLHLVETDEYRRRVLQMGENPLHVITTGALGLHNILKVPPLTLSELEHSLGFPIGDNSLLVTMHAATNHSPPPLAQLDALLLALDSFPEYKAIITYPNNDVEVAPMISRIESYASRNPGRILAVPSLGMRRYVSALRYVKGVVGNSSSGIVEAPSAGIPTLDIGPRQQGRARASSVYHCGDTPGEIIAGLRHILSPGVQHSARLTVNPYYRPDTLRLMCSAIEEHVPALGRAKHFFDL